MSIKTYRAKSMQEAIALVRRELGPEASVLHTREVNAGLLGRLMGRREIEIAASLAVAAPSRYAPAAAGLPLELAPQTPVAPPSVGFHVEVSEPVTPPLEQPTETTPEFEFDYRRKYREDVQLQFSPQIDEIEQGVRRVELQSGSSEAQFALYTDLIEADIEEPLCRKIIDETLQRAAPDEQHNITRLREILPRVIADRFEITGPIAVTTTPGCRIVALVGPTGVGKTTTIAKLAANYRLRQGVRVGLITVDTYRVAAVEQLRTYAEIIDLPMEVVSTPREMRDAIDRLADLDLILLDTAGRSPRDEVRIQELKTLLEEAQPDEVHLVLSATASAKNLASTAERFAGVGLSSLLLTKLDESVTFGHLVSLVDSAQLPISYLTNGQNVPDDISVAERELIAGLVLGD